MNVKKLKEAMEGLKEDLGDGLLASDIFAAVDGQSIVGYNTQPKASALFNQITDYLIETLKGSNFPPLGNFFMIDLVDDKMVLVIPLEDYRWGILADSKKAQRGLLLNVVLPKLIESFNDAMKK